MFGNFGPTEIILIVLVIVIFFGAKKIPELAKGLGTGMKEFKKAVKDVQEDLDDTKTEKENGKKP